MAIGEANSIDRRSGYRKPLTVQFSVATNGRFAVAPKTGFPLRSRSRPKAAGPGDFGI